MGNLLIEFMEFVIEMSVPASFVALIVSGVSIGILRFEELYKRKAWLFGLPAGLSVLIGAAGPDDHTSLWQWAYFVLPGMALSLLIVLSFFRKRLRNAQP